MGLAGLRADVPTGARSADSERAGRPNGARNTGDAASKNTGDTANRSTSGAASKNTGGTAATRVRERPGGGTPPPGLYTRLTFP